MIPREPKRTIAGRNVKGGGRRVERSKSWSFRFDKQTKAAEMFYNTVIPYLRRKELKKAIEFLRMNGHCPSPPALAEFIFRNPNIDREDLGNPYIYSSFSLSLSLSLSLHVSLY